MAINDKHGKPDDELEFNFDDGSFDDLDGYGGDTGDDRTPRSKLKRFASALKTEALSPTARRQYLHDALPQNYHTTLNSVESISDAASDLYNDSIMKEWDKSRNVLKRAIRADGNTLRKFKMGRLVDWAEEKDDNYTSDYNAEESEVKRQMGMFGDDASIQNSMRGGNLSPSERREFLNAGKAEEDLKEDKNNTEQAYQDTTIKQQGASVGLLSRLLDATYRLVDYQDQIEINYMKKMVEFNIRNLIGQRKALEQTALLRAEVKEGLTAITKNTGLPDYVKITSQENAKRLLRDKMVNKASDWAGNKVGGIMRSFMDQTKRNIASMGMSVRDKAEMYADGKEMLDGVGLSTSELLTSLGISFARSQASKRGGKYARKWLDKNPKYTKGLDFTEALIANSGTYANMAMNGRSGFRGLDKFLDKNGYSGLAQRQSSRLADSNVNKQDEAAFMDRKLKTTFLDVYPAWFSKIWKSIEGLRTSKDPSQIEDQHFDFKYNRIRSQSDLQKEFDNETFDENKVKNYNDGIDNWINRLDPKGTLSNETRSIVRKWLIQNHSKGTESFPVALYKGEGLPKGTSAKVRRELEEKVPLLAGFDPLKVSMIMEEGVGLEIRTLRENPEYRRMAKALGNADSQARARHPVDNNKLAKMTERYGNNFAVNSGLAQYDREGNVNVDNDNIVKMVSGGGNRIYDQRSEMDAFGDITTLPGQDPNKLPSDGQRTPMRRTGKVTDRKSFDQWTKAVLDNINGPRLRGFAKGGFTSGDPDEIAGVTHGDEAVVDSEGTKQNKGLLRGIMKLGAPVIKNGKFNRAYYKYLGFETPKELDMINDLRNLDFDGLKDKAGKYKEEQMSRVKSRFNDARDRLKDFRSNNFHQDGYNSEYGPTPAFMGPVRTGGLRNKIQSARDLATDPEELAKRLKLKERAKEAGDKIRNFDPNQAKETALTYAERAKEAVRKANQSKALDFEATRKAINKDIAEGKVDATKPMSLFLEGQLSPFITKGDMAVGRFRNRSNGHLITKPSDIMDDIVLVDENGEFETIATMVEMLDGVFDGRGNPVKLVGLDEGYRKYLKRTTYAAAVIKNSKAFRFIQGIKQKIWDDQPEDVCIVVNGNLVTVLKASGFISAQYLDSESKDVLKSHNDIQGAVVNLQGKTLLTLEELAAGLFDSEGNQLKISHLKHLRNKIVTKIETTVSNQVQKIKDKVLSKIVGLMEGMDDKDVYVMRWMGKDRQLTRAFEYVDIEASLLINRPDGKKIEKISDITGPVYSIKTKSIVVKDDEFGLGLFDSKGNPYKDFGNMSLGERVKFQQDKIYGKIESGMSKISERIKSMFAKKTEEEETDKEINDGEEPIDVYVIKDGEPKLVLTRQGFVDHAYRDTIGNIITKPNQIFASVLSAAGRILLTKEQIETGLFTVDGVEIKTAGSKNKVSPTTKSKIGGLLSKLRSKISKEKTSAMEDLFKPDNMDTPFITGEKLNSGKIIQLLNRKPVKKYADLASGAADSDDPSFVISKEVAATLVLADGRNALKTGSVGSRLKSGISKMFGGIKNKLGAMRAGSWQWMQAKREEALRNKAKDVNVTVDNKEGKEKKGFLGRLMMGLGTVFGGMFTTMMLKFKKMFKSVRNAIMISKMATAAGGVLGGAGGPGGGRGKLGLVTKLGGAALAAGGAYAGYNAFNSMDSDDELEGDTPENIDPAASEESGGIMSTLSGIDDATGGLGSEIATTAALGYGMNKIMDRRRAARLNTARPGLAARFGRGAAGVANTGGRVAGAGASALGNGVRDAGRAGGLLGRLGRGAANVVGRRIPGAGRVLGAVGSGVGKAAKWALSPKAAMGRLGNVARIGGMALNVGKFALGAARILSGPVGWGLMAATWIGGKLWEQYKGKKNPLMRFRIAQYGFDFDDEQYTSKLLDLENMLSKFVTVSGEGKPSIKEGMPEDQVFQLFEVNPEDPKNQEHVQRFIAWWTKRFKPVYLSYVKQTHLLLKKFDISQIDDELNKTNKLTLLKGVNFTNKQNNPYLISASPFIDPAEVPLAIDDVEKAYEKALGYVNDMPDDKNVEAKGKDGEAVKTGDDKKKEESGSGFSWLDNSKKAITDLSEKTLKVTKVLSEKTSEMFGGWFNKATENIKGLWGGVSSWLSNATSELMSKVSAAWDSIKNLGGSIAGGVAEGASAVGGAVSSAGNAVYDGVVGTYEKITGTTKDNQMMVYKAFRNAGLNDNQARILTSEVGRENDYQSRYIFGGHVDANNGAQNLGMISWQKTRASNLSKRLRAKGLIDDKGKMLHTQAALDEQAKFLVDEIKSDPSYKRTKDVFLSNPNVSYNAGVEVLGKNFIRWDYDGKKIKAADHHKKRDKYYSQISQQVGKDANVTTAAGGGTGGGGGTGQAAAPGQSPVKAGQTQVTSAEMKKLQTAAPRPASPLGPTAIKKWETEEATRKTKLAEARNGILKGTHVLSDAKPTSQTNTTPLGPAGGGGIVAGGVSKDHRAVKAATIATQKASRESTGYCAKFVANALQGAGYKFVRQNSAFQYATGPLQNAGFTKVQNGGQYQIGDVMVWPAHGIGKSGGATHGHIQIYNGRNWVSDFIQQNMKPSSLYNNVNPSLWRDSTLIGKSITGSVAVQGVPVSKSEAKETVADSNVPNKATPSSANSLAQVQQAAQRQEAQNQPTDINAPKIPDSSARQPVTNAAPYQDAQQRVQAPSNAGDMEVLQLQLQEARTQTKLLTEIRDAVTGQRGDTAAVGDKTIGALSGLGSAQTAQVELIAGGISAMVATLKDFSKNNKSNTLADQFPVSAKK